MDTENFLTSDLALAGLLLSSTGIHFQGLDGSNPRRLNFQFTPKKKAERIAFDFVAGTLVVNARTFSDSLRRAKDIVFDAERSLRGAI